MDLLTAILACSLYPSDDALVRAIAQSNSHGNQFAVIDAASTADAEAPPPEPRSLEAAMARLEAIQGQGGRPLLGWMQLPLGWVTMFGRKPRDAFDPCVSVSIGTAMLSAFDYECGSDPAVRRSARAKGRGPQHREPAPLSSRRDCIVRKYGDAVAMSDFRLVIALELKYQRPLSADIESVGIRWSAASANWGATRLLVPLEVTSVVIGERMLPEPDGF